MPVLQRLPIFASAALLAAALALVGCPGNEPRLDPKYLTGGAGTGGTGTGGGMSGSTGQGGCASSPVAAVCARASDGVRCALSNGASAFEASSSWAPALSDALGWVSPEYYETIAYPDVDGDGRADLCARGPAGLLCGLDTGAGFAPPTLWAANFADAKGWSEPQNYTTIRYGDLNGDGRQDVCARAIDGVYCLLSNGSSFSEPTPWSGLSSLVPWGEPSGYDTFRLPDVNHDSRADLCVRGHDGVRCALSNGDGFGPLKLWSTTFSDVNGWTDLKYYPSLRFPDVNGDGMADVCGRAVDGVRCALSNGATFGAAKVWLSQFSDANDWGQAKNPVAYADVDGDGSDDVCARASDGVYCALSTGSSFGPYMLWSGVFADAGGWGDASHYTTLRYPDLDGDGKADICGRSSLGMQCGLSNGATFAVSLWSTDFSDAQGFFAPSGYMTLGTPLLASNKCP